MFKYLYNDFFFNFLQLSCPMLRPSPPPSPPRESRRADISKVTRSNWAAASWRRGQSSKGRCTSAPVELGLGNWMSMWVSLSLPFPLLSITVACTPTSYSKCIYVSFLSSPSLLGYVPHSLQGPWWMGAGVVPLSKGSHIQIHWHLELYISIYYVSTSTLRVYLDFDLCAVTLN